MTRIDLFYNNLLACVDKIIEEFSTYYEANKIIIDSSSLKSDKFADFSSIVNDFRDSIIETKNRSELIENFNKLDEFVIHFDGFVSAFEDFSIAANIFFKYWVIIAKKIDSIKDVSIAIDENINEEYFKIISLNENIVEDNFINHDSTIANNIIIYSYSNKIKDFLNSEIHTANFDLLLIWLSLLSHNLKEESKQFVLLKSENPPALKELSSILKITVLMNGKLIKSLERYDTAPNLPNLKTLNHNEKYIQFDLISNILNEYNNQKFLLDKYLKIYHITENFMYKQKICMIQNERIGTPLQIRDFQTLYDKFSSNENQAIQEFFRLVFSLNYDATITFKDFILTNWRNLKSIDNTMPSQIDSLFGKLSLKYTYTKLETILNADIFAILVYKFRNTIVHNKDSEMHFESISLPESAKFLLENFFIPNLERITFHLIINKNQIVWYNDDKLILYHT